MPTVTLARAERFEMRSARSGRNYDISVASPLPFVATSQVAPDRPILIVLDSALTFGTAVERSSLHAVMGALESAVIVGVGYPGDLLSSVVSRTVDCTPETPADAHRDLQPTIGAEFGGADAFRDFLVDELVPEIRRRVPEASAERLILHGFSLAGMLTAYALLTRPSAFETVSMISPALWWNDFAVPKRLAGFEARLQAGNALPRVLIGVGGVEQDEPKAAPLGLDVEYLREVVRRSRMIDAAREFADGLSAVLPDVEFVVFEGEEHAGAATAGTGRAVGFALAPRAPFAV